MPQHLKVGASILAITSLVPQLSPISHQHKFQIQITYITGQVPHSLDVIFFDVKFDVTVFNVKKLSMLSFQYYTIRSRRSRIQCYPPFPKIRLVSLLSFLIIQST